MVFEKSEIATLGAKVIASLNTLTILYNSCDVALSVLALFIIWSGLINGKRWAFWVLLFVIGLVEVMAFIASAPIGNVRWQVNVVQSVLYVVGIGLSGYSLFKGDKKMNTTKESPHGTNRKTATGVGGLLRQNQSQQGDKN